MYVNCKESLKDKIASSPVWKCKREVLTSEGKFEKGTYITDMALGVTFRKDICTLILHSPDTDIDNPDGYACADIAPSDFDNYFEADDKLAESIKEIYPKPMFYVIFCLIFLLLFLAPVGAWYFTQSRNDICGFLIGFLGSLFVLYVAVKYLTTIKVRRADKYIRTYRG